MILSPFSRIEYAGNNEKKSFQKPKNKSKILEFSPKIPIQKKQTEAEWNVLVYLAADTEPNSLGQTLEMPMVKNVIDMEKVGSSENMNIIAQIDRGKNPSTISGGWSGCRRFHIKKDKDELNINSPIIKQFETDKVNMADPKTLTDFIAESAMQFPAKHTFLILNNHGAGWMGALQDFSDSDGKLMNVSNIRKAVEDAEKLTGKKIDIIGFDACVMGQAEVAYELKGSADILIASEEIINGPGWPYAGILSKEMLKKIQIYMSEHNNYITPDKLAKKVIEECRKKQTEDTYTMAAIRLENKLLEKANNLSASITAGMLASQFAPALMNNDFLINSYYMYQLRKHCNKLAEEIIKTDTPAKILREIIKNSQEFGGAPPYSDSKDIVDFAKRIIKDKRIKDENLKSASKSLIKTIKNIMLAEEHLKEDYPGANGLSIYFPLSKYRKEYLETQWAKDTLWDEAFIKIGGEEISVDTSRKIEFPRKSKNKSKN